MSDKPRTSLIAWPVLLVLVPGLYVMLGTAPSDYVLLVGSVALLHAVFAAGWAIQSGFTGYLNLGYAMFIGLGSYIAANFDIAQDLPLAFGVIVATIAVGLYSLAFGAATLRVKSHYIILATIAAAAALERLATVWRPFTRGEDGLPGLTRLGSPVETLLICAVFAAIAAIGLGWLVRSRHGLTLTAIRNDEEGATAVGIDSVKYRLAVFVLSGSIGGLGGALLTHTLGYAGTHSISVDLSLTIVVYGVVGGRTTVFGPMMVALALYLGGESLRAVGDIRILLEALVLMLTIRFVPEGLGPVVNRWFTSNRAIHWRRVAPDDSVYQQAAVEDASETKVT